MSFLRPDGIYGFSEIQCIVFLGNLLVSTSFKDTRAICCYNGYRYAVVDMRFFTQVILRLVVFPPFQET